MTTILDLARKLQRGKAPSPPIGRLLGFVLTVIEPGRAVFEMEAAERHHNSMGTPHGCFLMHVFSARKAIPGRIPPGPLPLAVSRSLQASPPAGA